MIKIISRLSLVSFLYLFGIYIISCIWGLPPYYRGFIIGFPAIYYQFEIGHHEVICGYTNIFNFLCNAVIITGIYYALRCFAKVFKKNRINEDKAL